MPKSEQNSGPLAEIEANFMAALQRLQDGRPTNEKLRKRLALGRLVIDPSSVAFEAGHSRTLVGMDGCRLPAVRIAILAAKRPVKRGDTATEAIAKLRTKVAELEGKLANADSVNAALVARLKTQKEQHDREMEALKRRLDPDRRPDPISGKSAGSGGSKVVTFRPKLPSS